MSPQRRARPAAVAAALVGVGLLLYRPRLVPELLPGTRGLGMPPAPSLASPILWSPSAPAAQPASGSEAASAPEPEGEEASAAEKSAAASWRDAPADFPAAGAPGASAVPAFASARDAAPAASFAVGAPSSAETDPVRAPRVAPAREPARRAERAPVPAPEKPASKRALLATGPAGSAPATPDARVAVDAGGGGGRRSAAAWSRRASRSFPLFRPPLRSVDFQKRLAARAKKVKPLLLSKLLGRGALRPPPASLKPPDLSALKGKRPLLLPGGAPVPVKPFELDRIEALDPRLAASRDRRRSPHWDAGPLWHDDSARGLVADARWLWLWKDAARWWAAPEPDGEPLLHHQGLWWSKQRGVWFVLHDGELWSWRRFSEWDQEGLIRLGDGVQLVYSADFKKVAVITPGEGAVLYDAATGETIGSWLESELPRRRPRAPSALRWPRGI